ncbi:PREDICTED: homeobox-leucine zipper protein ATHB-13-like [Ipomoea nil]|uniref:homeobox-leucine zipper protein ATHB-13-like n=1 Tax=Ipomoea nil TaxID=35883 RepID=UPI0009012050|nr:PREDICTED: homeobox-leucine zipper protein ATHB-13-like [Ipomoea nil]
MSPMIIAIIINPPPLSPTLSFLHYSSSSELPWSSGWEFISWWKRSMKCCEDALSHGDVQEDVSDEEKGLVQARENNKKKRLNTEQVKTLEKSFEVGNKMEPERKM